MGFYSQIKCIEATLTFSSYFLNYLEVLYLFNQLKSATCSLCQYMNHFFIYRQHLVLTTTNPTWYFSTPISCHSESRLFVLGVGMFQLHYHKLWCLHLCWGNFRFPLLNFSSHRNWSSSSKMLNKLPATILAFLQVLEGRNGVTVNNVYIWLVICFLFCPHRFWLQGGN